MVSGKGITYIAVNINHLQIIAHRTSNFNIINNCPEKQGNKFFNCPICVYFARPNYFRKKTRKMVQISQSTLDFLSDLKYNNEKDWFSSNRKRYEAARAEYDSFVQAVIGRITEMDPILKGLEAKSCIYRINRDIRFSRDKTIYKTHLGAIIVRGGRKNADRFAGYYIHIEPGNNSMIAGGAYMPPMPWLKAIRENIEEKGEALLKILDNKEFRTIFGEIEGEKLKGIPKGFSKENEYIELLRMKSYLASTIVSDKDVLKADFFDYTIRACKVIKPLIDFLNDY